MAQGTTFEAISKTDLASLMVMPPPQEDREPLGRVLDTLDTTIRQTEAIIEKLKQVKQGLLHDLLTRGIDDNGELRDPERHPEQFKDSPLGRIPKGWDARPLKELLERIDAGKSPSCPERPAAGDEWGVLKVSAVRPTGFQAIENKVKAEQEKLKAERDLQRIEVEAKQKVASAKAEADALALQRQQITSDLLQLRKIENEREAIRKWDGKLPQVTGGNVPFIQLGAKSP